MARTYVSAAAIAAILTTAAHAAGPAGDASRDQAGTAMCVATASLSLTHVRAVDPTISAALHEGLQRSPSLAALVARIEASDGIVYLISGRFLRLERGMCLRGGMSHAVTAARPFRVIKIMVETGFGDRTIATIGHELRHAVEVLDDSRAVDRASVELLYERIGYRVSANVFETSDAQTAERQVYRELSRCKN